VIRRRSSFVARRPPWSSYLVAYLLIGIGVVLVDAGTGTGPSGHIVTKSLGTKAFFAGLFVFTAALIYSVRFVLGLGGTPPSKDACPHCAYNLKADGSGTCPE
jgi:hypothetical protein